MSDVVCLVDGEPASSVDATDSSVLRGDGCFEAIRSYDGRLFRVEDHLDRLTTSAASLALEVPDRALIEGWMGEVAAGRGDCIVRIVLTRGPAVPGAEGQPRCIVLSHPMPDMPDQVRLLPVPAPWHPAGRDWELAGTKTISYAPNQAASRAAHRAGFDDAVLVSDGGAVLEGPTFSIGWVAGGVVYTPGLNLGILASVTRKLVGEIVEMREVTAPLPVLLAADEVFAMSTMKEVTPVVAVADTPFEPGPVSAHLAQRMALWARTGRSH